MSISKKNKLVVILVALLSLSVLFGSVNLFKGNADQTAYTVEQVTNAESGTFKMAGGAYIRNNDQDAVTSGLKYALTLSEDQYNGLKQSVANGVYESVEFGVFILPKAYNDVYAVRDYAFASDANENAPKYNWAIKNEEGEWVYTPETGKARIFNLTGDAMVYDEQLGVMAFYGVITNVLPENMGKEMLAVGYLAYTVNGETNYLFTAQKDEINNVRTMAYVAQKAIDAGATNATWLTSTYIQPVVDAKTKYTYVTEYYFENSSGKFVLDESKTITASAILGNTVKSNTATLEKTFDGYYYDANNENNVSSAKIVALNNATVLKRYYVPVQTIDIYSVNTFDLLSLYDGVINGTATATITSVDGETTTANDVTAIDLSNLEDGIYTVELKDDETTVYVVAINVYSSNVPTYRVFDENLAPEIKAWNDWGSSTTPYATATVADSTDENVAGKDGLYFKVPIKPRWASDQDMVGVQLAPLHTLDYYNQLLKSDNQYKLSFEWTYDSTYAYSGTTVAPRYRAFGYTSDSFEMQDGVWKTETIDLQTFVDNWDTLNSNTKLADSSRHLRELIWVRVSGGSSHNTTVGNLYIGNFKFIEIKKAVIEEEIVLIDTFGKTELDLTSFYTGNLNNATAELTDVYGNKTQVADATVFSLIGVKQGIYDLIISENENPVYKATIDIYNSADGLVWQEITEDSVNDAQILHGGYYLCGKPTYGNVSNVPVLSFTIMQTEGNTTEEGMRLRAIHSKEYYEYMSKYFSAITFDIYHSSNSNNLNIGVMQTYDKQSWIYHAKNTWKTYSVDLSWLIENWKSMNSMELDLANTSKSQLFSTMYGAVGVETISIGNFGYKVKDTSETTVVSEVQLVETSTTPNYNLTGLYANYDAEKDYKAVFTASSKKTVFVSNPTNIATANIPQGVYTVQLFENDNLCLTATVDIYTATDGVVWQEIDKYSVNNSSIWRYSYTLIEKVTTYDEINGVKVLKFNKKNGSWTGMRIRALHSKEYYELMSNTYESISFTVYHLSGPGAIAVEYFNGTYDAETGKWSQTNTTGNEVSAGKSRNCLIPLQYLIDNWDAINNLTTDNGGGNTNAYLQFFTTYYNTTGSVFAIGNFGCVAKTTA